MTFLWLIVNKGLPVGAWRARMGLPSKCTICVGDHEESLQYCFQTCTEVQKVWGSFRCLRQEANLTQEPENWEEVLMGKALATTRQVYEEEIPWGLIKRSQLIATRHGTC